MFVGWIRSDEFEAYKKDTEKSITVDESLFDKQLENYSDLCFKCKIDEKIVGLATAYKYQKSYQINVFETIDNEQVKEKLLKCLLQNIDEDKMIYALIKKDDFDAFEKLGFLNLKRFYKLKYRGTQVAFNFSHTHAKEVNKENFASIAHKIDKLVMKEDREQFIKTDMFYQSSLKLGTNFGYLHSRAVGNAIKISPWIMANEAFMDAEKLIRAVLHYRGLKQIVAYAPDEVEILSLYNSYKFEKQSEYCLVYKGEKPTWQLDNIYAF